MCARPSFCTFVVLSFLPVLCFLPHPVALLIGQNVLEMAHASAIIMWPLTRRDCHTCALLGRDHRAAVHPLGVCGGGLDNISQKCVSQRDRRTGRKQ